MTCCCRTLGGHWGHTGPITHNDPPHYEVPPRHLAISVDKLQHVEVTPTASAVPLWVLGVALPYDSNCHYPPESLWETPTLHGEEMLRQSFPLV